MKLAFKNFLFFFLEVTLYAFPHAFVRTPSNKTFSFIQFQLQNLGLATFCCFMNTAFFFCLSSIPYLTFQKKLDILLSNLMVLPADSPDSPLHHHRHFYQPQSDQSGYYVTFSHNNFINVGYVVHKWKIRVSGYDFQT